MKTILLLLLIVTTLLSCDCEKKERKKRESDLMLETEHCRYYCLERSGYGTCKVVITECDEGYSADASTSW